MYAECTQALGREVQQYSWTHPPPSKTKGFLHRTGKCFGCHPRRRLTMLRAQRPHRLVLVKRVHPVLHGGGHDGRQHQQLSEQAFREVGNPDGSDRPRGVELFELSPGVLPWRRAVRAKKMSTGRVNNSGPRDCKGNISKSKREAGGAKVGRRSDPFFTQGLGEFQSQQRTLPTRRGGRRCNGSSPRRRLRRRVSTQRRLSDLACDRYLRLHSLVRA